MKAIFFAAMEAKMPEIVDVPERENGVLDFAWMEEKIGHGCRCLDSALRLVDGKEYRFWVDDEGAFNARPTAYGGDDSVLFGNLFIFGKEDMCGELTEVTEQDLEHIKQFIGPRYNILMLWNLSFPNYTKWDFRVVEK